MPKWDIGGDTGTYFTVENWGMDWEEDTEAGGDEGARSRAQTRLERTNVIINKEFRT